MSEKISSGRISMSKTSLKKLFILIWCERIRCHDASLSCTDTVTGALAGTVLQLALGLAHTAAFQSHQVLTEHLKSAAC